MLLAMPLPLFVLGLIFAFLVGIVCGSFFNVCIFRLPEGQSLVTPPSHCPRCNTPLAPLDLIPLLSYLWLGRKCRYCHTPISPRYFIIELITGLLFTAIWLSLAARYEFDPNILWAPFGVTLIILLWIWASTMLVTFMIDLDTTYVIEPVTWIAMAAGILYEVISKWYDPLAWHNGLPIQSVIFGHTIPYLPNAVPGAILGFLVFVLMDWFGRLLFRKPGMGLGDAYIGAAIGALLGPGLALLSFGMAIMLGAVIGSILIVLGNIRRAPAPSADTVNDGPMKETDEQPEGRYMPFGPFLTACAVAIALAPDWFSHTATAAMHWWLNNPMFR